MSAASLPPERHRGSDRDDDPSIAPGVNGKASPEAIQGEPRHHLPDEYATWYESIAGEDDAEALRRDPGPLSRMPAGRDALPALALFMIFYTFTVVTLWYNPLDRLWVSGQSVFQGHQYWRLLTALAVHADLGHLVANALLFIIFGWMLRAYFGLLLFPAVSLVVGAAANLVTVAFYDPRTILMGASGMACGMVGLWIVMYVRYDSDHGIPMRLLRAVGFSLAMLFPSSFDPQTSYLAHAAGFGLGLVAGLAFLPWVKPRVVDKNRDKPVAAYPE